MNATFSRALLALVCYLLCVSLVYTAPPPPNQLLTCSPSAGPLKGTTQTYNNCSHICCATGAVPYTDTLASCCHDAATTCPMNMQCCTPTPAVTDPLLQVSRACYSPATQGCCQWKYASGWGTADLPTYVTRVQTYYTATEQCCATTGNGYFIYSSESVVVPKTAGSCVDYLRKSAKTFRCFANSDCPGSSNLCCRRPQQPTGETTTEYNQNAPGTCYDPKYQSCCGGSLQTGDKGNKYGDTLNYNVSYAPAELYNPYTQQCCALPLNSAGTIKFVTSISNNAVNACPCLANADCPSSDYTCCQPSEAELSAAGSAIKRIIKCDAGCPMANVSSPGTGEYFPACYGKCIRSTMAYPNHKQVCLTGAALGSRCDNMRIQSGKSFLLPGWSDLVKNDTQVHNVDCCPMTVDGVTAFSIQYNTKLQTCCPVMGTATSGATYDRFYTPVVQATQGLSDAMNPGLLEACVCNADSDCPTGQSCCLNANTVLNNGQQAYSGLCYDSKKLSCCAYNRGVNWPVGELYDFRNYQCCKNGVKYSTDTCQCHTDDDCSGEKSQCCSASVQLGDQSHTYGQCINPNKQGCCDYKFNTGMPAAYDKQSKVCCPLNGVQDSYKDCKCSADGECPTDGACCLDAEASNFGHYSDCSFDGGSCYGTCANTKIETCCDDPNKSEFYNSDAVRRCNAEYEKCCNGNCCNKATQTCKTTTIRMENSLHYDLEKETKMCTYLEHSSPSIVFHTWVFPAFLSIACFVFLAAGTKTALGTDISPNLIKLGLVGLSIFVGIMSVLLLWSPLWKYGFVIVVANTVILVSFSVSGVWPRRFAVMVAVVSFLWVVEPFGSNYIWSFGNKQFASTSGSSYNANGLNYAARLLQRPRGTYPSSSDPCTNFYQYWKVDENLRDTRIWNPQSVTRGICRRSWMHTITVLAGLITPFQTIFLLMAGLAIARATEATKDHKIQPLA